MSAPVQRQRGNPLPTLLEAVEELPSSMRIVACLILLAAVAAIDRLTGFEYSFASVYLVPIVAAAWFVGRRFAYGLALACVAVWFSLNLETERGSTLAVSVWNLGVRAALYSFVTMLVGAARDLLEAERDRSRTDGLTGVLTSRAFYETLARELDRVRRTGRPLSVAYLDIDDFKSINDSFGHSAGDALLQSFARCANETFRTIDFVARLGGDEFAIVMPDTEAQGAAAAVIRFRDRMAATERTRIAFSTGIVTCGDGTASVQSLVRHADALMYAAKRDGKNRLVQAGYAEVADSVAS